MAVRRVSAEAEAVLVGYDWPGNVRELQNVIERAIVLGSSDTVLPEDLPEELLQAGGISTALPSYQEGIANTKRELITKAFARAGGDYKKAAEILGLNPTSIYRLLYNLKLTHLLK
jgi:DNA-binding NtrC family response regulator